MRTSNYLNQVHIFLFDFGQLIFDKAELLPGFGDLLALLFHLLAPFADLGFGFSQFDDSVMTIIDVLTARQVPQHQRRHLLLIPSRVRERKQQKKKEKKRDR